MPDDFVREIYPLSQVRPITPHPADVRKERKRGKHPRHGQGGKKGRGTGKDRVSLKGPGRGPPTPGPARKKSKDAGSAKDPGIKTIDITV